MHRTECTVNTTNLDWEQAQENSPERPTVIIPVSIPSDAFEEHLRRGDDELLPADDIDVTFRYQTQTETMPGTGVLAVTDNVTGEFIVEANTNPALIDEIVETSKAYAHTTDDEPFKIRLSCNDRGSYEFIQNLLLVFDRDGDLLRDKSLIPNDVPV